MSERGTILADNKIPAEGTEAPVVISRHFGVDRPEVMRAWLAEQPAGTHYVGDNCPGAHKEERTMGVNATERPPVGTHEYNVWRGHRGGQAAAKATTRAQRRRWAAQGGKARWAKVRKGHTHAAKATDLGSGVSSSGRMIPIAAAASILGSSDSWIYVMIKDKRIRAVADGGGSKRATGYRVALADVLALADKRANRKTAQHIHIGATLYEGTKRLRYAGTRLEIGSGLAGPEQVISLIKQKFNGSAR